MAVRAPEFGLYVDVRLQRLTVNIAQPDLQIIEVGKDVCPGLYLVALVGDLVHAMPDILQPAAHGVTEKHIGRGILLRLFTEHVKHELPGFALVPCYCQTCGNPGLIFFAICRMREHNIIFVVFYAQAGCHEKGLPKRCGIRLHLQDSTVGTGRFPRPQNQYTTIVTISKMYEWNQYGGTAMP